MTITMYGIPNCDTIKKARKWLEQNNIDYQFHDYKKAGIESLKLDQWCKQVGQDALLNRRGTTWRKLPDEQKLNINQAKAVTIMKQHTSVIKRPVLELDDQIIVGFSPENYQSLL